MSDTKGLPGKPFTARLVREDIRHAARMESHRCVIARLLKRVVPDAQEVHVQHGHVALRFKRRWEWHFWYHDAGDLITSFDENEWCGGWVGRRVRFRPIEDDAWA